jgi:tetratricopeptide (TPR) repeat protein
MIGAVIQAFVLVAALAAEPAAERAAAPPAAEIPSLPDEAIVLALRRARISGEVGDRNGQRAQLDALVAAHPDDPTALAAGLVFHRDVDGETEATRALRARLVGAFARPGALIPLPPLQDVARDAKASDEDLTRVADVLVARPGTGADRVARLRLRAAVLDRMGRRAEMLAALDELAALDTDPLIALRLLDGYRDAGRWEDVLRVTAQVDATQSGFDPDWRRLEAFAASGRLDELSRDASALITRLRSRFDAIARPAPSPAPVKALPPYVVTGFVPFVFALLDAGRREPAERLVKDLEAASPGDDNVRRLHAMLFGTPDDRIAFLALAAGASIASADPDKIRAEAYQRLLARDYATAHDLYRRLLELDPAVSSLDGGDWFNYGLASIETSAWADAETAMTRALDSGASKPRAYAHRARARIMLDRTNEGIADAEAALAVDPKLKQACYAMYLAYEKLGKRDKAAEWFACSQGK